MKAMYYRIGNGWLGLLHRAMAAQGEELLTHMEGDEHGQSQFEGLTYVRVVDRVLL